jgi:putative two-component system response regulator
MARVLIIEHSSDLATLYERMLVDENLEARVSVAPADPLEAVRQHEPALIVLDILPYGDDIFAIVDALRSDHATRDIPVVALTTSAEIAEGALASYNVRTALVKPFDLEEFTTLVHQEMDSPRTAGQRQDSGVPDGFLRHAEEVLARHARDIVFRWVQRL